MTTLDTTLLKADDIRKLQDTVIDTRGDILFSRGVVLFEGQTEEQALPVYASKYWGATIHELGFCFVRVNGTDYFPFIWLAKALRIPWYVFADGEPDPVAKLNKALKKAGEEVASKCTNVVVLPSGNGFEAQLIAEGYLPEIEAVVDEIEGSAKHLDDYMAMHHGKPKEKGKIRDYKSAGARERAAQDYLEGKKTRTAKPLAVAISSHTDPARRFPKSIEKTLEIVGKQHGLQKAKDAK